MTQEQFDGEVARKSALIYLPICIVFSLAFLLAASLLGNYPLVARLGGTVWIALLTLIVSMPIVTSRVKKQLRAQALHPNVS